MVVGFGHQVGQGELLLLRKVGRKLQSVGGPSVGHYPVHHPLEEGLAEHHEVGKHGLVGGAVAEGLVAAEHIVQEGGATAPVPENKYGLIAQDALLQQFAVPPLLNGGKERHQAANGLGEHILGAPSFFHLAAFCYSLESMPVRPDEGIDWQFIEVYQTHGKMYWWNVSSLFIG